MMDVTPLDIRKKKGDFTRGLRGYDPQEVDHFLDLVAGRLEEVVKVNLTLRERVDRLTDRVEGQEGRERAVQEALVTAQSLKYDIQEQAKKDAERIRGEAEAAADRIHEGVRQVLQSRAQELVDLNQARKRFLAEFRSLLERELDFLQTAESDAPPEGFNLEGVAASEPDADVAESPAELPAALESDGKEAKREGEGAVAEMASDAPVGGKEVAPEVVGDSEPAAVEEEADTAAVAEEAAG